MCGCILLGHVVEYNDLPRHSVLLGALGMLQGVNAVPESESLSENAALPQSRRQGTQRYPTVVGSARSAVSESLSALSHSRCQRTQRCPRVNVSARSTAIRVVVSACSAP
jgi:hypothetical protein